MLTPEKPIDRISDDLLTYLRAALGVPALAYRAPLTQMQGGYETYSFRFQLDGAPGLFSGPLVLRLYPARYGPNNARWESSIRSPGPAK